MHKLNHMRRIAITAILFILLPGHATFCQQKPENNRFEVILLHTNDMHSKIDNMARLAYLADSLRAQHPDVYLVSSGDNFTGNPVVDMIPDVGYPMIDLMNRCGFVVSAAGNHEFDMGQEFLNKRMTQATFPFICANLDASKAIMNPVAPFYILKTSRGVEIPFLALLQLDENGLPSAHPSKMEGIRFTNGIDKALEYKWLKEKHGMLIGLTHLGVEDDVALAEQMPQFDLILGGHSHTLIRTPMEVNGVTILQAGSYLRYVGKTTLTIEENRIIGIRDTLIAMADLKKENPDVRKLIDRYNVNEAFAEVLGHAGKPLDGVYELGNLMADAITDQLNVDIALQNRGGIRLHYLPAGDITLKDVFALDPFNNPVVVYKMTPDEIRSLLCYGYRLEKALDLQPSGVSYRIRDDGSFQCLSVELLDRDGNKLDESKQYTVAMSSYIGVTYKFTHSDPGTTAGYTTAECLINYLKKKKEIDYSGTRRAFTEQ